MLTPVSRGHVSVTSSCFSLLSTNNYGLSNLRYVTSARLYLSCSEISFPRSEHFAGEWRLVEKPRHFFRRYPRSSARHCISRELSSVSISRNPLSIYGWPERTSLKDLHPLWKSLWGRTHPEAWGGTPRSRTPGWQRLRVVVAGGGIGLPAPLWQAWRQMAVRGRGSGGGSAVAICFAGVRGCYTNREHGRAGEGFGWFQKTSPSASQTWKRIGCFRASL